VDMSKKKKKKIKKKQQWNPLGFVSLSDKLVLIITCGSNQCVIMNFVLN
jgi:hypothetical protein